jgi:hypothetical protein
VETIRAKQKKLKNNVIKDRAYSGKGQVNRTVNSEKNWQSLDKTDRYLRRYQYYEGKT